MKRSYWGNFNLSFTVRLFYLAENILRVSIPLLSQCKQEKRSFKLFIFTTVGEFTAIFFKYSNKNFVLSVTLVDR